MSDTASPLAVIEPAELTIRLESPLSALTPVARHQIETAAKAVALSLGVVDLSENFEARRAELVAAAEAFTAPPKDDAEQELMLHAQRDLAKFRTATTKDGDGYKRPLNDARTKIIAIVDAGLKPVEAAEKRLQGFINNRQQQLARAREEAQRAQEREAKRVADEAAAAQRASEEAERARKAAELAQDPAEQARLAAEATRLEDEAFAKSLEAEAAPMPVVPVSDLPQAKEYFDFRLAGDTESQKRESLFKLLNAHPGLFTSHIEEEDGTRKYSLTLRVRDLTDKLNGRIQPAIESAPGIVITRMLTKLR